MAVNVSYPYVGPTYINLVVAIIRYWYYFQINMAMELAHSIQDHQINLVHQIVIGKFSKTPVKKIDQKSVTASIILYMLLSAGQFQKFGEELDKTRAEAAQKMDQGYVNVEMIVPSHLAGLTQVIVFMSNYRSASDSR